MRNYFKSALDNNAKRIFLVKILGRQASQEAEAAALLFVVHQQEKQSFWGLGGGRIKFKIKDS